VELGIHAARQSLLRITPTAVADPDEWKAPVVGQSIRRARPLYCGMLELEPYCSKGSQPWLNSAAIALFVGAIEFITAL
jgi:hypothetical protein